MRPSGRSFNELRPISFEVGCAKHAEGSCYVKFGDTHVLCTATWDETTPGWLRGQGRGWVTAEYGMLPRSTNERMKREAKGGQSGRTHEIQRLIGRSLRAVVDLKALGERQILVDCDVIQADGGTRTAAITGAGRRSSARNAQVASSMKRRAASGSSSRSACRSAPLQNERPAPRMTTQRSSC